MEKVHIFDTTLRDGEQSPGASMNLKEKRLIAHSLADLGVDIIEAGFPIASEGDFQAVKEIAESVHGPAIAGLARCHPADIDRAFAALSPAKRPRLHVFLATSPIHRTYKLKMGKEEVLDRIGEGVLRARSLCENIEFSAEDASRTEWEFLAKAVETAIDAGATTINVPDTVGFALPESFGNLISYLKTNVPNIEKAVLSVHCHNDLGLAVANSLAAIQAGVRQVECTINGLGERAGNCSLEELVMAMRTRKDAYPFETNVDTTHLVPTSRLVSRVTGMHVQRNKAIVGENAFAHEAGIHQHGVLEHAMTYEIMRPEDVGFNGNKMVLGKHSGRHALKDWMRQNGYPIKDDDFEQVFKEFKNLADRKKDIFEDDLIALMEGEFSHKEGPWELESIQTSAGLGHVQMATVSLKHRDGSMYSEAACGSGPVEALLKAIERIVGITVRLKHFELQSVTRGKDAQGEAQIQVEFEGRKFSGRAFSTDIFEASANAYLNIMNYLAERELPQRDVAAGRS